MWTPTAMAGMSGEYKRLTKRLGFLDVVDTVWVAEPMEHLKEVNFRCTMTGAYTRVLPDARAGRTRSCRSRAASVPIGVKAGVGEGGRPDVLQALATIAGAHCPSWGSATKS